MSSSDPLSMFSEPRRISLSPALVSVSGACSGKLSVTPANGPFVLQKQRAADPSDQRSELSPAIWQRPLPVCRRGPRSRAAPGLRGAVRVGVLDTDRDQSSNKGSPTRNRKSTKMSRSRAQSCVKDSMNGGALWIEGHSRSSPGPTEGYRRLLSRSEKRLAESTRQRWSLCRFPRIGQTPTHIRNTNNERSFPGGGEILPVPILTRYSTSILI